MQRPTPISLHSHPFHGQGAYSRPRCIATPPCLVLRHDTGKLGSQTWSAEASLAAPPVTLWQAGMLQYLCLSHAACSMAVTRSPCPVQQNWLPGCQKAQ